MITLTLLAAYAVTCAYVFIEPSLPSAEAMRNVELQVPLRVYTRSGQIIAQIGEQRRFPVTYEQIPEVVKQSFLAAEDDRFFRHSGVDFVGVLRALLVNLVSGDRAQGASTITMQAARNMFLSQDKTWRRKLQETFLTYRMEREFSKEQIFGLYLNVIFFGQRAYGVAAASETFFGKPLGDITVAEAATLAGIPKAPSRYNPIANPQLAKVRRGYVLRRMRELDFIDAETEREARGEEVLASAHAPLFDVEAPYVAEMARLEIRERFGAAAESEGYKVFTTIDARLQSAANRALRIGLVEYDRRHGWRGAVGRIELEGVPTGERLEASLIEYGGIGMLTPAVVVSLGEKSAQVYAKGAGFAEIAWDGLSWAVKPQLAGQPDVEPASASEIVAPGDVVHVVTDGEGKAQLAQMPEAQGALVAVDPNDGGIAALVGGFDYFSNKYNRVTQARRQPGSAFKPFFYSAALEQGFTPASVLPDAPVVLEETGAETVWRPENSGGQFHGPTRLREALVRSRNLVSIRLLRELGTEYSIDYVSRFGFPKAAMPRDLTLALGTLQATPLEVATGFATFANGGYRVQPYFIDRIENPAGQVVWRASPQVVCTQCRLPADQTAERVITAQNAYLITDMMADVITRGTGRRAMALGRDDLAGKTGTTNDAKDAWFNGFNRSLVATVWVGFDQERSLGEGEEGSSTAVPVWVHFMREALRGVPPQPRPMPDGLVKLRISPETGMLASAENPDAVLETFMVDHMPTSDEFAHTSGIAGTADDQATAEPLF
ncbi:MAG: penicillin-binding protein 1A [Gammaproteobacteria bacterium]